MKKESVKSFILYHNLAEPLEAMTIRERGELITAIFAHEVGVPAMPPRLSPRVKIIFGLIADLLDRNREAYIERCVRNAENGRRRGSARSKKAGGEAETSDRLQNEAKKAYIDIGIENDIEHEIDLDIENGIGYGKENGNEAHAPSGAGEFSTSPEHADAVPPTDRPPLSREERARIFREEIPRSYIRSRLDRAEVYAEEHDMSIGDVIVYWWLYDRAET